MIFASQIVFLSSCPPGLDYTAVSRGEEWLGNGSNFRPQEVEKHLEFPRHSKKSSHAWWWAVYVGRQRESIKDVALL